MDLGFSGLIEKIEERFGKLITNLLLASLLFLIFLWVIEKIFDIYVSGVTLWNEGGKSAIIGLAQTISILVILTIAVCIVFWAIIQRIEKKAIQKVEIAGKKVQIIAADKTKELDVKITELKKTSGEIQNFATDKIEELDVKIAELKKTFGEIV